MKRIWFSLIFLAAAISLCVFEQIELHRDFHIVIGTAENAIALKAERKRRNTARSLKRNGSTFTTGRR
jgi:hypothetical protein